MPSRVTFRVAWVLFALVAALGLTACSASRVRVPSGVRGHYGRAAFRSAADWRTWAPLLAAVAIGAAGWDEPISDSLAGSETSTSIQAANPGLSSQQAENISENLHGRDTAGNLSDVSTGLGIASGLLLPLTTFRDSDSGFCVGDPSRRDRLTASLGAFVVTAGSTTGIKALSQRMRPDRGNDQSFPSAHTSMTACGSAFARYEIQRRTRLGRRTKALLDGAYSALPLVTGLLRVRAKKHYPTDVLCGWALGNFVGSFAYEGLLLPRGCQPHFEMRSEKGSTTVALGLVHHF